jgi:hypothetical protein
VRQRYRIFFPDFVFFIFAENCAFFAHFLGGPGAEVAWSQDFFLRHKKWLNRKIWSRRLRQRYRIFQVLKDFVIFLDTSGFSGFGGSTGVRGTKLFLNGPKNGGKQLNRILSTRIVTYAANRL